MNTLPNVQPALTLEQADMYAARVRGSLTEEEWRAYQIRCATERRAPITYAPPAIAMGVGTNGRLDRNTLAARWHGLRVIEPTEAVTVPLGVSDDAEAQTANDEPVTPAVILGPPSNTIEPPAPARAAARADVTRPAKVASPVRVEARVDWKKIKGGSARAQVLQLMDGTRTAAEIDAIVKAGSPAMAHAKCTARDCGIGYEVLSNGALVAVYPAGVTYEMVIR